MTYLGRLIAMSRGETGAPPAASGAEPGSTPGETFALDHHEVVEVRSPSRAVAQAPAPVRVASTRRAAPPAGMLPPPTTHVEADRPVHAVPVTPGPKVFEPASRASERGVAIHDAPAGAAVATPLAKPIDPTSLASPAQREATEARFAAGPGAPPPRREAASPGIHVLREVMHWVGQPASTAPSGPMAARSIELGDDAPVRAAAPREPASGVPEVLSGPGTPRELSTVVESAGVELSIGAIEVTIESPRAATPRPRSTPRPRRDTRLERRLPRGG